MVETLPSVNLQEFRKNGIYNLAVNGPWSVGKTTLAEYLSGYYGTNLVPENYGKNPHLVDFYDCPEKHAFDSQMFFLKQRGGQLLKIAQKPAMPLSPLSPWSNIIDQDIEGNGCFELAQYRMNWITKPDHEYYLDKKRRIQKYLPPVKAYLVPMAPAKVLFNRIYGRSRDFETRSLEKHESLMNRYLETLVDTFKEWIWTTSSKKIPVYEMKLGCYQGNREAENKIVLDIETFWKSVYPDVPFLNK